MIIISNMSIEREKKRENNSDFYPIRFILCNAQTGNGVAGSKNSFSNDDEDVK